VLAVVHDQQQRARRKEVDHRLDQLLPGQRPHVERGRDGVRDPSEVSEGGELDEGGTVRVRRRRGTGELEREPRLAHAAGSREGEQARAAEHRLQLGELAVAPDERACVRRQRARPVGVGSAEGGELRRELRRQLRELVAPPRCPVVVAVLR
jgi:hypothetical protein